METPSATPRRRGRPPKQAEGLAETRERLLRSGVEVLTEKGFIRLTRAGVREAALADYVKFARAKGLAPARVVLVHILKNIMIPIVTVLGLEFGSLIAFAVVTESIFAWPGMGKLIIDSIYHLDRPVIVAYLMLTVGLVIAINLLVDLVYTGLDPRVRLREIGR